MRARCNRLELIKLKLFSSPVERLINGIEEIKKALAYKYGRPTENTEDVNAQIDHTVASATSKLNCSFLINQLQSYFLW